MVLSLEKGLVAGLVYSRVVFRSEWWSALFCNDLLFSFFFWCHERLRSEWKIFFSPFWGAWRSIYLVYMCVPSSFASYISGEELGRAARFTLPMGLSSCGSFLDPSDSLLSIEGSISAVVACVYKYAPDREWKGLGSRRFCVEQ